MAREQKNLTVATVNGVKWTMVATIVNSVLQIGYTAVMARLLSPAAFGLVALAGVILRFGVYFAKMGMERAIVQKPDLTEQDVRVAFTSSVLLGLLFAGLLVLGAPLAARIVHQPEVIPVVRALAIGIFLSGLNGTAMSLLHRAMRFRALAIMEMLSFLLSYLGLGMLLAWQGFGVWALVGASLGQGLIITVFSYSAVRHSVRLLFSWAAYRPLLAYGSRMSVISFVEFVSMSLDTLLIGRLLGPAALGIYTRGSMLIALPVHLLSSNVAKVIFPSFSKVQADRAKLRDVYLSSITLIAMVITPVCAGVMVAAPEIVLVMLGPHWLEAIPILRVICATYALSAVTMFAGVVCDATAVLTWKLNLNVFYVLLLAGLMFFCSRYGLLGVAWALVAGELVRTLLYTVLMRRVLAAPPLSLLRAYGPGVLAGLLAALGIAAVRHSLQPLGVPTVVLLGLEMLVGAVVLGSLGLLYPPAQLRDVLRRLLARLTGSPGTVPASPVVRVLRLVAARLARLDGETLVSPLPAGLSPNPLQPDATPDLQPVPPGSPGKAAVFSGSAAEVV
ncbi:Membrane protein involved in the export of O-antigen and teichoic acid [Hymenobacter daecheongensis DSM 21074]|uniref:Membrane protein involved in the export of O-antigen and teichoic acid n=1 Tax=Hymenobacter daecheongensis DSM 21074 TaxID=1121955 RepID=A0A1M6KJ15_9BACT|nr:lipopolysaccharide biosynthesis protein [Hymenobacter daecheongensis]SHJ58944.1 Membrane protein involved in the export of O-antigen and teichoic acid [Hymenobacter daecheongensis DSM 21074]